MPISLPRIRRMSGSDSNSRSLPRNRTRPPAISPGGVGTSRMMDSEVTDLPLPDSPTIAKISPAETVKLMPSTACATAPSV